MKTLLVLLILSAIQLNAQWGNEWTSSSISYNNISGWIAIGENGDKIDYRLYILSPDNFQLMQQAYSTVPHFTYNFTEPEKLANYQIYSLSVDLTGDGVYEFYVLSYYGTAEPYRQAFKIFDITTGNVLFQQDDASSYFSYPTIWDADDDGIYECTFAKYDYPNFVNYTMEVYNTGTSLTGINNNKPLDIRFELRQNFPNPFNPTTNIEFTVASPQNVKLDIYDATGALVKTLINEYKQPGTYTLPWNGIDQAGRRVASGAYFYQIKEGSNIHTKKMILIK